MSTLKDRAIVEERRQKAYTLHLEGYNQTEIAKILGVAQRTVSVALSIVRRKNAEWYQTNKNLQTRFESYVKEHEDRILHIYNEAFRNYRLVDEQAGEEKPLSRLHAKISLIQVMRNLTRDLADLHGLRAPSIDELAFTETLNGLLKDLDELRQKEKVKPL